MLFFDESIQVGALNTEDEINFEELQEATNCLTGEDEDFNAVEGALEIACLAEANYNKFTEATCKMEIASLISEGTLAIYEEAEGKKGSAKEKINAWFTAAKNFVKRWASYVKAFFKKAIAMIESLFANDAKFVKDNGARIKNAGADAGKLKFNGFKFTIEDIVYLGQDAWGADIIDVDKFNKDNYEAVKENLSKDTEEMLKAARSRVAKSSSAGLTDKEFKDELFKKFRDGKSKKTELTISEAYGSISGALDVISKSSDAKAKANKDYEAEQKSIKEAMRLINNMKKGVEKADADRELKMKAANKSLDYLRKILKLENTAHGIHIQAIRANNRQARACCSQVLFKNVKVAANGANGKKMPNPALTGKNESTDMTTSYLTDIDFE